MGWIHTDKAPRYMVKPKADAKPVEPHEVDAHVNAQGDWICHKCGLLVQLNMESPRRLPRPRRKPRAPKG